MLKSNVSIDVKEYYTVNEIARLRFFVIDNMKVLTNQKISIINKTIEQLMQYR